MGIFCVGIFVSAYYQATFSWRLGRVVVPGEAHYRSLEFSPFLSTRSRSNNKNFVNYKQRALPSTDIPVCPLPA